MSLPLTTFYIVRHGESEGNVAMAAGTPIPNFNNWDPDLTERGIEQAKAKFEAFKHIKFDVAFSSDLQRARKTAEIIAAERKLAVITTATIRESNRTTYHYNNPTKQAELDSLLKTLSAEQRFSYRSEDMESHEQAATRLITFIREAAVAYPGKTVLIVAHGTIIRSFLIKIGFGTIDQLPSKSVKNVAHVVVETDGVDFFVKETDGVHKRD